MAKSGSEYLKSSSKRAFDVLGGAVVGAALIPAGAVAYTAAAVDNKSLKPFFTHQRIGLNNQRFPVSKLRTLKPELVKGGWNGEGAFDSRASGIGLFLRRYGLDEIPQLKSVLEGDMSLIGIRVVTEEALAFLESAAPRIYPQWEEAYGSGKPALIGPGQIFRHRFKNLTEQDFETSLLMDIYYSKHASLLDDLRILGSAPLKLLAVNFRPIGEVEATNPEVELPAPVAG